MFTRNFGDFLNSDLRCTVRSFTQSAADTVQSLCDRPFWFDVIAQEQGGQERADSW
jgi:hypothetical protein